MLQRTSEAHRCTGNRLDGPIDSAEHPVQHPAGLVSIGGLMHSSSAAQIAETWIRARTQDAAAAVGEDVGESPLDRELPRKEPALCLAAIMEVLQRIDGSKPSKLLAVLAAGPLENLLFYNGPLVVAEVDRLARQSRSLAPLPGRSDLGRCDSGPLGAQRPSTGTAG